MTINILKAAFCFILLAGAGARAQENDSAWVVTNYSKKEVMIPMRDGVKLHTTIYSPKDKNESHPILLVRTPYSVAPYGEGKISSRLYKTHWKSYARAGYVIVLQDVRGCYMSEGEFVDVRPFIKDKKSNKDTDEASDAYDAIEWLVKNVEGNNGNVGVFGISYPGFYSTMAALSGHPALKAVSPQAPVTDWFIGDDFHHNGAFALMDGFSFYYGFGAPRPKPTATHGRAFNFGEKDSYSFHLKQGALKNYRRHMGDSVKFWNDLMEHPDYDEFWKRRDARRACNGIKPAMMIVGGTFDAEDCFGAWNLYKAIEKQSASTDNRLVMGPWFHGGWNRSDGAALGNIRFGERTSKYYQEELELPFFEHFLRGKSFVKKPSEATVFFSGENKWRTFESWPPAEMKTKKIFFTPNGRLQYDAPPGTGKPYSSYVSDPSRPVPYIEKVQLARTREYMSDDQRFAARRTDVLVFETETLTEDLTLAGPVKADLRVELSTTDADFVVKIIDVFPDDFVYDSAYCCREVKQEAEMAGYQMLVRGEIMRGKYRNSFEKPEPFVPGKLTSVSFELPDVAHTFKKGHRLMVQIQSSWFPLFDRNPQQFTNIYTCSDKDFIPCSVKIHHSAANPSAIILPVLVTK